LSSAIDDFFLFVLLDIGSRKIVLGGGGGRRPTSILSASMTFLSQVIVAAMETGRVRVAVTMYDIVPRSN
jgi:hypothetical protein